MMGFLFGLMIGSMAAGGGTTDQTARQMLSQIPLRCLYLVDDEAQYIRCRWPSMREEFYQKSVIGCSGTFNENECKNDFTKQNIKWELSALKQLADAAAKQKDGGK